MRAVAVFALVLFARAAFAQPVVPGTPGAPGAPGTPAQTTPTAPTTPGPTTPTTPTTPSVPGTPSAPNAPGAPTTPPPNANATTTKPAAPAIPPEFLPPQQRYAQFFGGYPLELVDRPIVDPAGVTMFAPSYQFRTYVESYTDGFGVMRQRRTGFFHDRSLDLELSHVFGPVNVGVDLGRVISAYAGAALPGLPLALSVGADFDDDFAYGRHRYSHGQAAGLVFKHVFTPHRFAMAARVAASVYEVRTFNAQDMAIEGTGLSGSGGVSGVLQLTRNWCIYGGFSGVVPFYKSADFPTQSSLGANLSVNFAVWKWDFFVNTILSDITRSGPSTLINIGFAKRWGI